MFKLKKIKYYLTGNLILIYQMGKVGSTCIEKSLMTQKFQTAHYHSFFSPLPYIMFKNFYSIKYYVSFWNRLIYRIKMTILLYLIKRNKNVKIISLIREPISRNLSMFFQDAHIPAFELSMQNDNRIN